MVHIDRAVPQNVAGCKAWHVCERGLHIVEVILASLLEGYSIQSILEWAILPASPPLCFKAWQLTALGVNGPL